MVRLLLVACACACLWLASCVSPASTSLSQLLVAPAGVSPLLPEEKIEAMTAMLDSRSGLVQTPAGVPIFWRALDPGDYRFHYRYGSAGIDATGEDHARFDLDFQPPLPSSAAPRGTVILLHGWMMDGGSLLPWAVQLAQSGYRSITLDLRNHGRSGGAPSGYGTREADDVSAVIRQLRRQGEVTGPVYLLGVSYGAATALFTAREMGDEIQGVVAMESFANAGRAIRDMVPHMLARQPASWEGRAGMQLMRWRYGHQDMDAVIADADARLGLDLDRIDVASALADVPACLLLLHGDADQHVPVAHGRRLAAAAPRAAYMELPGENHLSLPMRLDELGGTVRDWLAATAQPHAGCPPVEPPLTAHARVRQPALATAQSTASR